MAVVTVSTAEKAQAIARVEGVPHPVAWHRVVDGQRGVGCFAASVHRDDFSQGLEYGIRRIEPIRRDGPARRVVGKGHGHLAAQGIPERIRGFVAWVQAGVDFAPVAEVEHVPMAVEPTRPLVAEQGDEATRGVEMAHRLADLAPEGRLVVHGLHAPVIVVGERSHIEARHVLGVGEILRRGPGAVGELGVPVKIAPSQSGKAFPGDQRVGDRREFGEFALAPGCDAVGAGLLHPDVDAAVAAEASSEIDPRRRDQARWQIDENNAGLFHRARAAVNIQGRDGQANGLARGGGGGQDQANLARRSAHDIDPG